MLDACGDKRGHKMFRSLIAAFSMYSRIPMPRVEWDEKTIKYVMCFFPAVGIALGAAAYFAAAAMRALGAGTLLFSAVMTVIPIAVTGGIHMDGFMDTADALSSYGDREKKLEILKDPHLGAFSVIHAALYFILMLGLWSEAGKAEVLAASIGFVLSRALSGLSVVLFPKAKSTGLAAMFSSAADKKRAAAALAVWAAAAAAAAVFLDPLRGAAMTAAAVLVLLIYRRISTKRFGGITGDLAGWFLQLCEAAMLAAAIIAGRFV